MLINKNKLHIIFNNVAQITYLNYKICKKIQIANIV